MFAVTTRDESKHMLACLILCASSLCLKSEVSARQCEDQSAGGIALGDWTYSRHDSHIQTNR
jgi:hypothetical protein